MLQFTIHMYLHHFLHNYFRLKATATNSLTSSIHSQF